MPIGSSATNPYQIGIAPPPPPGAPSRSLPCTPVFEQQSVGLTKLYDCEGNEYLYHANGYVVPIVNVQTGGVDLMKQRQDCCCCSNNCNINNNNNNGNGNGNNANSMNTNNSGNKGRFRHYKRRLTSFIDLSQVSSNSPLELLKYKTQVFQLIQFLGDIDSNISNRYGVVNNL